MILGDSEKYLLQTEHAERGHTLALLHTAWQLTYWHAQPYFRKAFLHLCAEAWKLLDEFIEESIKSY